MIAEFLPWTLFSVSTSLLISYVLGVLLGMIIVSAGFNLGSRVDYFSLNPQFGAELLVAILVLIFLG